MEDASRFRSILKGCLVGSPKTIFKPQTNSQTQTFLHQVQELDVHILGKRIRQSLIQNEKSKVGMQGEGLTK